MRIASTTALLLAAAALPGFLSPAQADAGVPPVWSDFQPAVSTQYRPPDGGWRYRPPNNRLLVRDHNRQALPTSLPDLDRSLGLPPRGPSALPTKRSGSSPSSSTLPPSSGTSSPTAR